MKRSASASRSSVLIPGLRISRIRASVPATMRPARPMMSISRGDFNVIMLLAKGLSDSSGNGLDRASSRNVPDQLPGLVPVEDWCRLLAIGAEAGSDRLWVIVSTLLDGTPPSQPGQDFLVTDIEEQNRTHPATQFGKESLHTLRLRNGPDHP